MMVAMNTPLNACSICFFDSDDTDAARFHPKIDANGNCETKDQVSLFWIFFLNMNITMAFQNKTEN